MTPEGPGPDWIVSAETIQVMTVLVKTIESRDPYTAGHTWRVSRYVLHLARRLGWTLAQCTEAELGGMLHDLGKLKVSDSILNKRGPLSPEEYHQIQEHPSAGADIIRLVPSLRPLLPYIEAHHERFDGRGYPQGLAAHAIPLPGRMVAVADTFDAMTSPRPYRPALPAEQALAELRRFRGTQFDPDLVDLFLQGWDAGDFIHTVAFSGTNLPLLPCRICGPIIEIPESAAQTHQNSPVQCPSCGGLYQAAYIDGRWVIEAPMTP